MKRVIFAMFLMCSSLAYADTNLTIATQMCLEGKSVQKRDIDGTSDSLLGIGCSGDEAQNLFNSMRRYAKEYTSTWSTGARVITRYSGQLKCHKRSLNPNGSSSNKHWCIMTLDVSSDYIKALEL